MTKTEKKLLKCCNKHFTTGERITTQLLAGKIKLTQQEIKLCAEYLYQKGYVTNLDVFIGGNVGFTLTHLGRHYREIQWEKVKHFLFESIFVPIVVSMATTLLTLLVQWLLTSPSP